MAIQETCNELIQFSKELNCSEAENLAIAARIALEKDYFHLAVLGEFKRGKSSLINSLIGCELLPTDVLPTTATINIIQFGTEETCEIFWNNGNKEKWPLDKNQLQLLNADSAFDTSAIRYVLISICNPLLQDGLILIDTPGVNDLSASRDEIIHQILPHCDAALFLLDAVAPITRSESEFLKTKVFNYSLDSLIFILSKSDRLDSDELEEALTGAQERIVQVVSKPVALLPYSSRRVIAANSDPAKPGELLQLMDMLDQLRKKARDSAGDRNIARLRLSLGALNKVLDAQEAILTSNDQMIKEHLNDIHQAEKELNARFNQLLASIDIVGRQTLLSMFSSSCQLMKVRLVDELSYMLRSGGDLEKLWKENVPLFIERNLRQFSEAKSAEIHVFLNNFTSHVAGEYQRCFQISIKLDATSCGIDFPQWRSKTEMVSTDEVLYNTLRNYLPTTIVAVAGSLVLPGVGTLIGMGLGAVLKALMDKSRRDQMLPELLNQLPNLVDEIIGAYQKEAEKSLSAWFDQFESILTAYHNNNLESISSMVQKALAPPELKNQGLTRELLTNYRERLQTLKQQIKS